MRTVKVTPLIKDILEKEERKMGKAKVCDRCGKVYSPTGLNELDSDLYMKAIKIKYGHDCGKDTIYIPLDLCHECGNDFDRFMKKLSTIS